MPDTEYRFPQLLKEKPWLEIICVDCRCTMSQHITAPSGKIIDCFQCGSSCKQRAINSASRYVPSRDGRVGINAAAIEEVHNRYFKEETPMFSFYQCSILDPKNGEIIVKPDVLTATSEESARLGFILDNSKKLSKLSTKRRDRLEISVTPLK